MKVKYKNYKHDEDNHVDHQSFLDINSNTVITLSIVTAIIIAYIFKFTCYNSTE